MEPSPRLNRPHPALHALAWGVLGLVYFLGVLPFRPGMFGTLAAFKTVWAITGFFISTGLGWFFRRIDLSSHPLPQAAAAALGASTLAAFVWVALLSGIAWAGTGTVSVFVTRSSFPFVAVNHLSILAAWSGGYLALSYWNRSREEAMRTARAETMARDAQLAMLRYQLDPHFLFNSLASLRALIGEDPERAREMVGRLSDFLRTTLDAEDRTWSTVAREIDTVRGYLEIERVRFEERLAVDIEVAPEVESQRVPGFLIHGLVENALKHGRAGDGCLSVTVRVAIEDDALSIRVCNTGTLERTNGDRAGIGLENIRGRLVEAYDGAAHFSIEQLGEQVCAWVRIPESAAGSAA